jgi:hypothetical protein
VETVRFEVYREGIQEAEARIFLEGVLSDPEKRSRIGDATAAESQAVLDRRVRDIRTAVEGMGTYVQWKWYVSGSNDRARTLYATAARVRNALGQ